VAAIGGTYFFLNGAENGYVVNPADASYVIEGQSIKLTDGKASVEAAPGSASKTVTQIFGEPVLGDIDNDGKTDAAVMLVQGSGGSGTFFYVAAAMNTGSETRGTNAILIGDRIAPQNLEIRNGEVIVNYADRKPGEPMTAQPSVGVSKYLTVLNGVLQTQIACTMEAKLCSDGSYVGRTGPSCEFSACPTTNTGSGIRGKVMLGPTCPVERIPPDPGCADKPYAAPVTIFHANDLTHAFLYAQSDANGMFSASMPPGEYILIVGEKNLPRCDQPQVTVLPHIFASTTISCDTGIR